MRLFSNRHKCLSPPSTEYYKRWPKRYWQEVLAGIWNCSPALGSIFQPPDWWQRKHFALSTWDLTALLQWFICHCVKKITQSKSNVLVGEVLEPTAGSHCTDTNSLWEFVFILRVNTGPDSAAPCVLKSLGVSYLFPPLQLRYNLHYLASLCGQQFKKFGTGGRCQKWVRNPSSSHIAVHSCPLCSSTSPCRNSPKVRLGCLKCWLCFLKVSCLQENHGVESPKKRIRNVLWGKVVWKQLQ